MKLLLVISIGLALATLNASTYGFIMQTENDTFDAARFDNFIIKGKKAYPVQFPWQIYITASNSKVHMGSTDIECGGALITKKHALTAAHCCYGFNRFELAMGITNIKKKSFSRTTSNCKIHEGYAHKTLQNDIAVLRFRAIMFILTIQPIALPDFRDSSRNYVDSKATTAGWGQQHGGHSSGHLHYIDVQIIKNEDCKKFVENVYKTTLCGQGKHIKSICHGDSGGPLVFYTATRPILIGISSFVVGECTDGRPMGFTRVTKYLKWIRNQIYNRNK